MKFGSSVTLASTAAMRFAPKILVFLIPLWLTAVPVAFAETLEDIRASGQLLWGADAEGGAPYVFPDPESPEQLIGFEVDLADAIATELGVTAHMVQTEWRSLVPALQRGDFHIALNGIEWTMERSRVVDFSRPYYIYEQQLVVRKDEKQILSFNDVGGKTVGTLAASVAQQLLEERKDVTLKVYEGQVQPYRDLELKRLDAVFMDWPIAAHYARPNPNLKFAGAPLGEGLYVIALRKGDAEFLNRINRILEGLYADGTLQRIYEKWGLWNQKQISLRESDQPARKVFTAGANIGLGTYLPLLLKGAGMTVLISVVAMALAMMFGGAVTLARLMGGRVLKSIAVTYVEIMRGTPLLLQLYIIYYGLPNIGISLNAFTAAVLGLGLNYAAYESEIYRAGLGSIPKGQSDAALSLGMTRWMIYRRILIPQARRVVLPPVTNDFISLFKDSSLVSIIAIVELTKSYNMLAVSSMKFLELGLLTAALYLMMSLPLSLVSTRLERKLQTS
jgi:polar amino acid transport system substrate-binding protein